MNPFLTPSQRGIQIAEPKTRLSFLKKVIDADKHVLTFEAQSLAALLRLCRCHIFSVSTLLSKGAAGLTPYLILRHRGSRPDVLEVITNVLSACLPPRSS